jgi:hypothetical protein
MGVSKVVPKTPPPGLEEDIENPLCPLRAEKLPPDAKSQDFPGEDFCQTVIVESGDFMGRAGAGKPTARVATIHITLHDFFDDRPEESAFLLAAALILGQEVVILGLHNVPVIAEGVALH